MMTPRLGSCCAAALTVLLAGAAGAQTAPPRASVKVDSATISGLGARNIGSAAMSGRIAALAAVHEGPRLTVYVGAASGGVWKSVNAGTTFKPVFDKQAVQSIGAVTIDPKNPKVIWVGTGEAWTRNSASIGEDRKSTRLNSSHSQISYAVFCLKKKKHKLIRQLQYTVRRSALLPDTSRLPLVNLAPHDRTQ